MKRTVLVLALVAVAPLSPAVANQRPLVVDQARLTTTLGEVLESLARLEGAASARRAAVCGQLAGDLKKLRNRLKKLQKTISNAPPMGLPGVYPPYGFPMPPTLPPGGETTAPDVPPPPPEPTGPVPLASSDLGALLQHLETENFSEGRLRVLVQAVPHAWFSSAQVLLILGRFDFGNDKLQALRLVAPKIVDRQNAYTIYQAFTFDAEKAQAQQILKASGAP